MKLEYDAEKTRKDVLLEDVCLNYIKCIETVRDTDIFRLTSLAHLLLSPLFPEYIQQMQHRGLLHSHSH